MAWRIIEIRNDAMTDLDFTDQEMNDLISYFDLDDGDEIREKTQDILEKIRMNKFFNRT